MVLTEEQAIKAEALAEELKAKKEELLLTENYEKLKELKQLEPYLYSVFVLEADKENSKQPTAIIGGCA